MTVLQTITTYLSAERNGCVLPKALVKVVAKYLVDVVEIEDVKEVKDKALMETAKDAWTEEKSSDLPAIHRDALTRWLAAPSVQHEVSAVSSRPGGGGEGTITEDEEKLFGDAGPTMRERAMLMSDKTKMGISGLRILMLSTALELGRVPTGGQAVASIYGSDPRLSDMVKAARKASMQTLTKVLEGGDVAKLGHFMMSLVRDYSEQGMIIEAQLITAWWTETQSVCGVSWSMMAKYVRMYLDKYVGRGLPETVDLVLLNRLGGSGGGEMVEAAAEALKMAKDAKARADRATEEAGALKSQLATLRNELAKLKAKEGGNPGGPSTGGAFKGTCNICGQFGHRARECPNKDAVKDKDKDTPKDGDDK